MREIKFRAWHEGNKEMISAQEMGHDELTINPDGRGFVNVNSTSPRLSQYFPHMIPMQFTGLHDKNGKEIYEGDIVADRSDSDLVFPVQWDEEHLGYWMPNEFDEEGNYPISHVQLEVVGNIYQNPELLKV